MSDNPKTFIVNTNRLAYKGLRVCMNNNLRFIFLRFSNSFSTFFKREKCEVNQNDIKLFF